MKIRALFVAVLAFLALPAVAQHDQYHLDASSADAREDARLCPNTVVASRDGGTFDHLPLKWKTYCFGIRSLERCGDDFIATPLVSMTSWSDRLRFDRRRVAIVVSPHVKRHPFLYATLRWHGVMDYPEDAILYVRTKAELIRWESILLRPAVRGNTCVVQRFR